MRQPENLKRLKMTNWYFFVVAFFSVSVAYLLNYYFSGPKLNGCKYLLCIAFNCTFGFYYLRIVDSGCLAFQGCMDRTRGDYALIAWIAFVCAILHAFSFPTKKELRSK